MASWEYPTHKTFPIVPPLEEVEQNDRPGIMDAREQKIREDWVKSMELRILRDQMKRCYKTEGVNHYQNCKELSEKYLSLLEESKVKGYRKLKSSKSS
ncbi:1587_t:CDS:2 [Funneliformis geosporum]|uniref:7996_t:CDS:1 n=1 Tax=Funneliformis geosporum TaxID=1117311 RepID=A0A9W4T3C9_9GLOM|nr:7996_t:CDS:2 [Funneliformis geosporum]CAI2191690.1 1587_t:CDS:2 [Funneliformis geosporum]